MARHIAFSDKKVHGVAASVLMVGLLLAFVRPHGTASGPSHEIPRDFSILVESRLPADLQKVKQATIHFPQLPLSAKLAMEGSQFRCHIHSLKPPQSFLVTLYLAEGEQAIARGELVQRGQDWVAQVGVWRKLTRGGSLLASQAAGRPASVQWQRPELVTPRAAWLGRLEVRRTMPPQNTPEEVGGHHNHP